MLSLIYVDVSIKIHCIPFQTDTKLSLEKKIDELSEKLGEALTSIKKKDESIMVSVAYL
jgi:hypothetical protein